MPKVSFIGSPKAIVYGAALVVCLRAGAQEKPDLRNISVIKKPEQPAGTAIVMVAGKARRILQHALQAWPIMDAQNALILVLVPKKVGPNEYHLRLFEGATRKRRDLGIVPFVSAQLIEEKRSDGSWVFALSGSDGNVPWMVVGDEGGIYGRLQGASAVKFEADALQFRDDRSGQTRTVTVQLLLAQDMTAIYEVKDALPGKPRYAQFRRDGSTVLEQADGGFETGEWWTDGTNMIVKLAGGSRLDYPRAALVPVEGVPAGTRLAVRILQPLSSRKAKEGDSVQAVLISPASINGNIFLPQGSLFSGTITRAHGVGWGLKHETAALTVTFDSAKLPDGQRLTIHTRLVQVENSREKVNDQSSIQGIRSTGTLGHSAETKIASFAAVDPVAYLFTTVSATGTLGFAEPEILYPSGTELDTELISPLITSKVFPRAVPVLASSPEDQSNLQNFVKGLPFRTMTKGTNKPSDLTNLVFIGPPEGLRRAFAAAGWLNADQLNANTTFETLKSITGNETYNQAPMSTLLLDERPPIFTLSKTTNTFSSRHHIRVFDSGRQYEGTPVLTASSTQDIGIGFSSQKKTFIHVIDQYIDNERSKVVNDLEFTGCVEGTELIPRPWVPQDAYNATGDKLRTDGAIAVLKISDCSHPRTTPGENAVPPNRFERITRDTMLTIRNEIWRGNVGYQGVKATLWVRNYFAHKDDLKPETGAWRKADISGTEFKGISRLLSEQQPSAQAIPAPTREATPEPPTGSIERSRWEPPRYEIAVQGGYLLYPNTRFETLGAFLIPAPTLDLPTWDVGFQDKITGGWSIGGSLTANTWRWVSSEFGYHYQRGRFTIGTYFANLATENEQGAIPTIETAPVGLVTRQFEYNVLIHARRPESRWRPYAAIGPALELISLADSPIKKAPQPFKLGLQMSAFCWRRLSLEAPLR